ncbi:MAG: ROK family protein [Bacteroidota bacterium]
MQSQKFTIGIDIGGTNTVVGLVAGNGDCVERIKFFTQEFPTAEVFKMRLLSGIRELSERLSAVQKIVGIGIAAPAARHREGTIQSPANLQWGTIDIVNLLKPFYNLPIVLMNDSNAAALGEMKFGLAKGMKNFVVITMGTGLGAGIVVDGRLLYGENGVAGELGHMTIEPGGRLCGCKRQGCVETYVSATGIRRTVFELLARSTEETELRDISYNELTAEKVHELASRGDTIALEAFEITGKILGRVLSNTVAVFDPEAIILSGGLMHAGDLLLEPTTKSFTENVLMLHKRNAVILKSHLKDGEAAILGVSSLVSDGAFVTPDGSQTDPEAIPGNVMIEGRG